jgi:hypothetical protein
MHRYIAFYAPSIEPNFPLNDALHFVVYKFCYRLDAITNYCKFYSWSMHRIRCPQIGARKMLLNN